MISYGFFNSVNGDRKYNASSFNNFFEGLISSNGIFEQVDDAFKVTPANALTLHVGSGKAMVNSCWVKSDATENVTLDAAHNLLPRYDAIVLRYSITTRNVSLNVVKGTPASTPVKPAPTRDVGTYEIILAYIYVKANMSTITMADIQDCRYDTDLCGVITGLIKQVDTSTLYQQYAAQFQQMMTQMAAWEAQQKAAFETWFASLSDQLNVNTYIQKSQYNVLVGDNGAQYIDVPASLNYANGDILEVFVGGVLFVENLDWEMRTNEVENIPMIYIYNRIDKGQTVTFYCLKSKIGSNTAS